jgi:hypothetical protein
MIRYRMSLPSRPSACHDRTENDDDAAGPGTVVQHEEQRDLDISS